VSGSIWVLRNEDQMYHIIHGSTGGLNDADSFLEKLNNLQSSQETSARQLFNPDTEMVVARAPGRLDVMGGIADYSGSLVLQLPIREATFAALQRQIPRTLRIVSLGAQENHREPAFEMPLADLEADGKPISYEKAQDYFKRESATQWAAYAAGTFLVLMKEQNVKFDQGANLLISSDVPEGKGVSSSAAIEVAAMQAVSASYDIPIDARKLAVLCQKVENLVVGAPCGVMDQMTASCGRTNQLLTLLCQPAELQTPVEIPDEIGFWGLDSGVRHSVSGADYGSVRIGAFMGYRMIAEMAGLTIENGPDVGDPVSINDPIWKGYLANLGPAEFEQRYAQHLPEQIKGRDFLSQFSGTTDTVTRIDPNRDYAVRIPTAHPIYEHFRVRSFAELLNGTPTDRCLQILGELMYQSHASYSACGLGTKETDLLVDLVRQAGPDKGLFGAKITGGGSGGTVAVLGRKNAEPTVRKVAEDYARQT